MPPPKKLISTDTDQAFIKSRTSYLSAVGAIALVLWIAIVVIQIVKSGRWAWSLPYILLSTPIAVLVTIFLCRYRVTHNKPLSYGTLFTGPFFSTCLVMLCYHFYFVREKIFTLDYWNNLKGGWFGVLCGLVFVSGICVLPAITIVIYYQKRNKISEAPIAKQKRIAIPEWLRQTWRWAIEILCSILLLGYWIFRCDMPTTQQQVMIEKGLINWGSCIMILLFVTSMVSLRHHLKHGLFGLLIIATWFGSLIGFPHII